MSQFQPGQPRPPGAGRRAGTPNRTSLAAAQAVAEVLGDDCLLVLARKAREALDLGDNETALKALALILPHTCPKLQAVAVQEVSPAKAAPVVIFRLPDNGRTD